jgi:hypothetical protein
MFGGTVRTPRLNAMDQSLDRRYSRIADGVLRGRTTATSEPTTLFSRCEDQRGTRPRQVAWVREAVGWPTDAKPAPRGRDQPARYVVRLARAMAVTSRGRQWVGHALPPTTHSGTESQLEPHCVWRETG